MTGIRLIGSAHWLTEGSQIRSCMSESELYGEVPSAHILLVHYQNYRQEHDRNHTRLHTINDKVNRASSAKKKKRQNIQVRNLCDEFSTSRGFQFLPSVTEGPRGRKREGANSSMPIVLHLLDGAVNAKV